MSRPDPSPPKSHIATERRESLIGRIALITYGGLTFEVMVKAHKVAYGTDRWLVIPVKGHGETWVQYIEPKQPF